MSFEKHRIKIEISTLHSFSTSTDTRFGRVDLSRVFRIFGTVWSMHDRIENSMVGAMNCANFALVWAVPIWNILLIWYCICDILLLIQNKMQWHEVNESRAITENSMYVFRATLLSTICLMFYEFFRNLVTVQIDESIWILRARHLLTFKFDCNSKYPLE